MHVQQATYAIELHVNVQQEQCSSGVYWSFFLYAFIVFFSFSVEKTIYQKVAFVYPFLVLKNRLEPLIISLYRLLSNSQYHWT